MTTAEVVWLVVGWIVGVLTTGIALYMSSVILDSYDGSYGYLAVRPLADNTRTDDGDPA